MDLATSYLGLALPHPFVVGASPLSDDLDTARRVEDGGAAALVMRSLFEEQITAEQLGAMRHMDLHEQAHAEALSYFPGTEAFALQPEGYLEHLQRLKDALDIPVIGSLNGTSLGGWLDFSRLIEEAGADALELNLYFVSTDPARSSAEVEAHMLEVIRSVRERVRIPVAVKLSPFYTALARFARDAAAAGADGLVLFNRFYQPDLDVEELRTVPSLKLSTSDDLLLRLRWLAILYGRAGADLAVTGGVHTAVDAVKAVMAGACAVQVVSALLERGPDYLGELRRGTARWLEEHEYDSLRQMLGSMSLERCPDPASYERANYMEILQSWTPV